MRPCFLLLITLTSFCYEAFANPWDCCGIINSPSNFSECVIHGYQNPEITGKIALAMFASNKTMIYSPYTIVVNSYYCHSKNYHFKLFTDSSTPFSYTSDKRWNKIGIVVDAFAPNGWGLNIDYLVVIDADLIVIDFSLDIGSVTSSHPDGHLFMSRDASDIANSGFFIVKNSQWSRDFFSNWWKGRLTSVTDQSAFNVLYHTLNSPKEIVLLPPDEINSEYPVYQTFNPQSRVLHLFGEIDEIRGEIFRFAAAEMCQHLFAQSGAKKRRRPNRYPPQMGITSAKLRQTAVEQILLRRSAIKSQILSCVENECPEFALVTLLESLQSETTSVCGYGRGILADQSSEKCLELSLENYDVVKALVPNNTSIAFLDHLSQNLYAAFSWSSDSIQTLQMGEEVQRSSIIPLF